MSTNKKLLDAILSHRLGLLRFEGGALNDLLKHWNDYADPILARLDRYASQMQQGKPLTPGQRRSIEKIQSRLADKTRQTRSKMIEELEQRLEEAVSSEYRLLARSLQASLPETAQERLRAAQPASVVQLLGDQWRRRLDQTLFDSQLRLQASLARALTTGEGMAAAVRRIERQNQDIRMTRSKLTTLVRTEIQTASNMAAQASYRANVDVVKAVQYLAALDSRTCMICAPLHNTVYPLTPQGHPGPTLPQHPRCRCFYVPVTRSFQELGLSRTEAAEMTGKQVKDRSYPAWFNRQSAAQQKEILGATRYKLWRSGRVSLEDLAQDGRLLSLGQLQAKSETVQF